MFPEVGEATVTTEDALQAALDADPGNSFLREVLADLLEDQDDPRGPGYRALGQMKLQAFIYACNTRCWMTAESSMQPQYNHLPKDWFRCLAGHEFDQKSEEWWRWPSFTGEQKSATRREVEDATALAFSKLSPWRQSELLGRTEVVILKQSANSA